LSGDVEGWESKGKEESTALDPSVDGEQIAKLEEEVAALRNEIVELKQQFAEFRKQFD
jgi:uncharacterized protein